MGKAQESGQGRIAQRLCGHLDRGRRHRKVKAASVIAGPLLRTESQCRRPGFRPFALPLTVGRVSGPIGGYSIMAGKLSFDGATQARQTRSDRCLRRSAGAWPEVDPKRAEGSRIPGRRLARRIADGLGDARTKDWDENFAVESITAFVEPQKAGEHDSVCRRLPRGDFIPVITVGHSPCTIIQRTHAHDGL